MNVGKKDKSLKEAIKCDKSVPIFLNENSPLTLGFVQAASKAFNVKIIFNQLREV